jgi:hypothetical protein
MKIGVYANPTKPGAAALLRALHKVCDQAGAGFVLESRTARLIRQRGLELKSLLKKIDLLLVAGTACHLSDESSHAGHQYR